jgi:hypothetical protein
MMQEYHKSRPSYVGLHQYEEEKERDGNLHLNARFSLVLNIIYLLFLQL